LDAKYILGNVLAASKIKLFGVVRPRFLWVETSDLCNSRCVTCNIWQNKTSRNVLDLKVLAKPLFRDVQYIINSGGEPSLSDLSNILLTEHRLLPKAVLQVSTNGLLVDKVVDAVCDVLRVGAWVDVGLSLDGVGEAHDRWRGVSGNFEKVKALTEKLVKLQKKYVGLNVTVGSTLTDKTFENSQDLYAYSKKYGVNFMWHWFNQGTFYNNNIDLKLSPENAKKALTIMSDSLYRYLWLQSLQGQIPRFECYALRSFAVLKCTGEIVPCLSRWNQSIGNIMEHSGKTVWSGSLAKKARLDISKCAGCLNSWGCGWSLQTKYFPSLQYKLKEKTK